MFVYKGSCTILNINVDIWCISAELFETYTFICSSWQVTFFTTGKLVINFHFIRAATNDYFHYWLICRLFPWLIELTFFFGRYQKIVTHTLYNSQSWRWHLKKNRSKQKSNVLKYSISCRIRHRKVTDGHIGEAGMRDCSTDTTNLLSIDLVTNHFSSPCDLNAAETIQWIVCARKWDNRTSLYLQNN